MSVTPLITICLLISGITVAQETTIRGYYIDNWGKPIDYDKDSMNFEFYANGVAKLTEDELDLTVDYYKDSAHTISDYTVQEFKRIKLRSWGIEEN